MKTDTDSEEKNTENTRIKQEYLCDSLCQNSDCEVLNDIPVCTTCFSGYGRSDNESKNNCVLCTSVHEASTTGNHDCVEFLINDGNSPDEFVEGTSALYQAVRSGHFEMVELLIQNGANLENKSEEGCVACTRSGDTPFHEAVIRDQHELVEFFLANGADVNSKNGFHGDRMPIQDAVVYNNYFLIDLRGGFAKI